MMNFFCPMEIVQVGCIFSFACRITTRPTVFGTTDQIEKQPACKKHKSEIGCKKKSRRQNMLIPPQNQQRPTTILQRPPTNLITILIRQREQKPTNRNRDLHKGSKAYQPELKLRKSFIQEEESAHDEPIREQPPYGTKLRIDGQPGDGEELDQKRELGMCKARGLR
uniref:Uncharacterized protein n=1 Tax=Aegilops tauschii subsp. strangulata TaxID=200361 RepID=A0A453S4K2_AEGTS